MSQIDVEESGQRRRAAKKAAAICKRLGMRNDLLAEPVASKDATRAIIARELWCRGEMERFDNLPFQIRMAINYADL